MYTSQIHRALMADPYVSQYFEGVFPCDLLPKKIGYPCAVVANTDPVSEKGEHWVAYHFDNSGQAEYFDSYGFPPPEDSDLTAFLEDNCVKWKYNKVWLQGIDSNVCGQYCIAFLARRARGHSLTDIVTNYRGQQPGDNDQAVASIVNSTYNITTTNTPTVQQTGGMGQCCCSKLQAQHHSVSSCDSEWMW
jgi:hypothetical protein